MPKIAQISPSAGAPPSDPIASGVLELQPSVPDLQRLKAPPQTPGLAPSLRIPDYAPVGMDEVEKGGTRCRPPLSNTTVSTSQVTWLCSACYCLGAVTQKWIC